MTYEEMQQIREKLGLASLSQSPPRPEMDGAHSTLTYSESEHLLRLATLLDFFARADATVKARFADPEVLSVFIRMLPALPPAALRLVLRSLRILAMDTATLALIEARSVRMLVFA